MHRLYSLRYSAIEQHNIQHPDGTLCYPARPETEMENAASPPTRVEVNIKVSKKS